MTKFATTVQACGFAVVLVGLWLLYPPAAVLAAGVVIVAVGVAWELLTVRRARARAAVEELVRGGEQRIERPVGR